jgi:DNA adenine methylase
MYGYTEPFLKWAGGKRLLLDQIVPLLPPLGAQARYFEPFLGGGALFFALKPRAAVLSDSNPHLIEAFRAVRDDVARVIECLRRLPKSLDSYYRIRASHPRNRFTGAARFIYLNKTCFNGLYRENLAGEFNVPVGRHKPTLTICNAEQLRAASAALRTADLLAADFEAVTAEAKRGDLVYFDPPYTTAHTDNGFIEYNAEVFSWADQTRLAELAARLARRGCHVVVSNAYHDSILSLYAPYPALRPVIIDRFNTMAGSAAKRFATQELLFVTDVDR